MASNTDDVRSAVSKDISALQQEVARLQKMISAQGAEAYYEVRDRAGKAYEEVAPRAKTAVAQIKAESVARPTPRASIPPQPPRRWHSPARSAFSPAIC